MRVINELKLYKKKGICIATGTRADYGLLRPLIRRLSNEPKLEMRLLVTGTHLSPEFGNTYQEIEADGYFADAKIELILSSDSPVAMAKSTGLGIISFADYFQKCRPDLLVVLGDRFEMFACVTAAAMLQIPIAHLYGGDTTEGAVDEFIRHSITKMSQLHFVSNEQSRKRVIQLGEAPDRVWNVGALGVENALHMPLLTREELGVFLGLDLSIPYVLITFHPVTLEEQQAESQLFELFKAMDSLPVYQYIVTKANADSEGRVINAMWDTYATTRQNVCVVTSLGAQRYLSAMRDAVMVVGNSSSGLYETPSFGVPCVNIGSRQRGRMRAQNVIDCEPAAHNIIAAMQQAVTAEFQLRAKATLNPFGDGQVSEKIVNILKKVLPNNMVDVKKEFYGVMFDV